MPSSRSRCRARAHELEVLDPDSAAFAAGQSVHHQEFGCGEVLVAAGERITVVFEVAGERTVHGRFLTAGPATTN